MHVNSMSPRPVLAGTLTGMWKTLASARCQRYALGFLRFMPRPYVLSLHTALMGNALETCHISISFHVSDLGLSTDDVCHCRMVHL